MILSKDTDIEAHFGATITILWFCFKVPYIAEKLWIKYDIRNSLLNDSEKEIKKGGGGGWREEGREGWRKGEREGERKEGRKGGRKMREEEGRKKRRKEGRRMGDGG